MNIKINNYRFAILKAIMVVVTAFFIVVIGFIAIIVHESSDMCGTHSSAYKDEKAKVKIFNNVTVLPGQQNKPAGIYNSTDGECNLDVAQSYSATKDFTVSMPGAAALESVSNSLERQGYKLDSQYYNIDGCSNVSGFAEFKGKGMDIDTEFDESTTQCKADQVVTAQKGVFLNTTITSIGATVNSS
jgi:hypothetical protein